MTLTRTHLTHLPAVQAAVAAAGPRLYTHWDRVAAAPVAMQSPHGRRGGCGCRLAHARGQLRQHYRQPARRPFLVRSGLAWQPTWLLVYALSPSLAVGGGGCAVWRANHACRAAQVNQRGGRAWSEAEGARGCGRGLPGASAQLRILAAGMKEVCCWALG